MTWQNNCLGQIIWHAKFQNPIWTGVGGRINPSLYNSVFNALKRKAGSINWLNAHLGQTIWYVKFQYPIWKGGGGAESTQKRKGGSITWQNGCFGQRIWLAKFRNPILNWGGGAESSLSSINMYLIFSVSYCLKIKAGSITRQNGCSGKWIWYPNFHNPTWTGGWAELTFRSLSLHLIL